MRAALLPLALLAMSLPATAGGDPVRVIDGDTIETPAATIRIANIDAPEIDGKCDAERRLAAVAKRRAIELLSRDFDVHPTGRRDRYGRMVATVTIGGRDFGEIMIAENLARPWRGRREPWCATD